MNRHAAAENAPIGVCTRKREPWVATRGPKVEIAIGLVCCVKSRSETMMYLRRLVWSMTFIATITFAAAPAHSGPAQINALDRVQNSQQPNSPSNPNSPNGPNDPGPDQPNTPKPSQPSNPDDPNGPGGANPNPSKPNPSNPKGPDSPSSPNPPSPTEPTI